MSTYKCLFQVKDRNFNEKKKKIEECTYNGGGKHMKEAMLPNIQKNISSIVLINSENLINSPIR